jgi:hypothetical protein
LEGSSRQCKVAFLFRRVSDTWSEYRIGIFSRMAKLIFSVITSLDGYIEDERGNFDWAAPDEEVHSFVNELERPVGTYLYGRRMYETMVYWETAQALADQPPCARESTPTKIIWSPPTR